MAGPLWIEVDAVGGLLRASDGVRQDLLPVYGGDLGLPALVRSRADVRAALARRAGRVRLGFGHGATLSQWNLDLSAGVHGVRCALSEAPEVLLPDLTRAWAEHSLDGVVVTDADGRVQWANQAFAGLVGYPADEVVGLSMSTFRSSRTPDRVIRGLELALAGTGAWVGTLHYRRSDGAEIPVRVSLTAVRDEDGRCTNQIGVLADLTEDQERDRLESLEVNALFIGRLARGLAHDVNNLAGELQAVADEGRGARDATAGAHLERIAMNLGELGRQMLTLATHSAEPPPADLNRVARDLVWLLRRASVGTRTFSLDTSAEPVWVDTAGDALLRALSPPALRAASLLGQDERLTVSVCREHGEGVLRLQYDADATERERLRGMFPDEHTVTHTGNVLVARAMGAGASLSLELEGGGPVAIRAAAALATPATQATRPHPVLLGRAGRALVVEDNDDLREMVANAIRKDFPATVAAEDGLAALEVLERVDGEVDIAIVDLMMPRLTGLEFIRQARARWPRLRFVIMSGAPSVEQVQEAHSLGVHRLLAKPFRLAELREVVAAVVNGA